MDIKRKEHKYTYPKTLPLFLLGKKIAKHWKIIKNKGGKSQSRFSYLNIKEGFLALKNQTMGKNSEKKFLWLINLKKIITFVHLKI